jgi:hypothetical protein
MSVHMPFPSRQNDCACGRDLLRLAPPGPCPLCPYLSIAGNLVLELVAPMGCCFFRSPARPSSVWNHLMGIYIESVSKVPLLPPMSSHRKRYCPLSGCLTAIAIPVPL